MFKFEHLNPNIKKVPKFSAIEVMTGAIIKKPFDTIIPVEQAQFFSKQTKTRYLIINKKIKKNNFIRFAGSDFKKSEIVIKKGEIINSQHILAFKTLGIKKVTVKKKPKLVLFVTKNLTSFPSLLSELITGQKSTTKSWLDS